MHKGTEIQPCETMGGKAQGSDAVLLIKDVLNLEAELEPMELLLRPLDSLPGLRLKNVPKLPWLYG